MTRAVFHRAYFTLSYIIRSHKFCVNSPLFVLSELSALIDFFLPCKNSFYVTVYSCVVVHKRLRKLLSFKRRIFNDLSRFEDFTSVVHSHGWGKSLRVHEVSQIIEVCDAILPICHLQLFFRCLKVDELMHQCAVVESELLLRIDVYTNLSEGVDCWRSLIGCKSKNPTKTGHEIFCVQILDLVINVLYCIIYSHSV